jgi:hypothetical protein
VTIEEFRAWMTKVNTMTLELILLHGDAGKPEWYTAELTAEIQRRRVLLAEEIHETNRT